MPVIAGTTKESVINKAREVLIAKKIPYTIKKSKTWFWVSSTKPAAAQTALREAGLEMNPITTMHSVWCTKCNAISKFEKSKGKTWKCQKCGAKISVVNPSKVKAMVHPEALESLARYKDDLKAGHTSAAEYWRGQAGAYFTANPKIPKIGEFYPEFDKDTGLYCVFHTETGDFAYSSWASMGQATQDASRRNRELHNKKVDIGRYKCPVCGGTMRDTGKSLKCPDCGQVFPYSNPEFLKKTAAQRRAGYALGKELGLEPTMARRTRDWHSPKVYRMLGLPVPPLSERRAMGLVNPRYRIKAYCYQCKKWHRYGTRIYSEHYQYLALHSRKYYNPLTAKEKREITNLANTQFAISRKYSDDPVRSSFWYGRSVGMGKIAKMFNPKVKKWDPIFEGLDDEEEDNMIGAEINPLKQFCCSICPACAPKRLLPHSKFPERMDWLRHHYMKKHPGLWPWTRGGNPITAIGSAAITGVGLGIGFKSVDWMAKKIKKNPVKPHTTAMVSKLPKCDFCARIAHYDGKTAMGPWAYMCEPHFEMYGVGLGLGKGQILIVKEKRR